jgi:hypothetical protein
MGRVVNDTGTSLDGGFVSRRFLADAIGSTK